MDDDWPQGKVVGYFADLFLSHLGTFLTAGIVLQRMTAIKVYLCAAVALNPTVKLK